MVVKTIAKAVATAPKAIKTAQKVDRALPKVAKGAAKAMTGYAKSRADKAFDKYLNISPYRDENGKKRGPVEKKVLLEKSRKASKAYDKANVDYEKVKKLANKLSKMFD